MKYGVLQKGLALGVNQALNDACEGVVPPKQLELETKALILLAKSGNENMYNDILESALEMRRGDGGILDCANFIKAGKYSSVYEESFPGEGMVIQKFDKIKDYDVTHKVVNRGLIKNLEGSGLIASPSGVGFSHLGAHQHRKCGDGPRTR